MSGHEKKSIVFEGETKIYGDHVQQKVVYGSEIHGDQHIGRDNISVDGDGNIVGNGNVARFTIIKETEEVFSTKISDILERVSTINRLSQQERAEIISTVQKLQKEIKKGESANTEKVSPWLKMLKQKAPEIVGALLDVFVHPLVGKTVAAVGKAILKD